MKNGMPKEAWEVDLESVLGCEPQPDFDAWRAIHAEALPALGAEKAVPRQRIGSRAHLGMLIGVTAALALVVGGSLFMKNLSSPVTSMFAWDIPGVDDVRAVEWTEAHYVRATSEDRRVVWILQERLECAFRQPGLYRKTYFDSSGLPKRIEITDLSARQTLVLEPNTRKAVLKFADQSLDRRGPFAWVGDDLRAAPGNGHAAVQVDALPGSRRVDDIDADVVRARSSFNGIEHEMVFLFHPQTKQLVGIWSGVPGEDFDARTSIARTLNTADPSFSQMEPIGVLVHGIRLNGSTDASQFQLDIPPEYLFQAVSRPKVFR